MSRHGPDPERLFYGEVVGTARLLAVEQGSISEAITHILEKAQGSERPAHRGRGQGVGAWSVAPGHPTDLLAAGLLAASVHRLDLDVLRHWISTGQQRRL